MRCDHPMDQRWQYPMHWLCCRCYKWFWGKKEDDQHPVYAKGAAV